jgi:hypothetical protein
VTAGVKCKGDTRRDFKRVRAERVLKRRSHLVTFRVSADEHAQLVSASTTSGSRSVAEFVRDAAIEKTQSAGLQAATLTSNLAALINDLGELDETLVETRRIIRRVLGVREPEQKLSTVSEGQNDKTIQK